MLRIVFAGCALIASAACGYQRPCGASDGSVIQVDLVDAADEPLSYGAVRAVHTSGTLNDCLPFEASRFSCGPLAAGVWTVYATAPGFSAEQFALEATGTPSCGDPEVIVRIQLSGAPLEPPSDAIEPRLTEFGRCPTTVWAGDTSGTLLVEVGLEALESVQVDLATDPAAFLVRSGASVAASCAPQIEDVGAQTWLPASGTLDVDVDWIAALGDGRQAYAWHARAEEVVLEEATTNASTQLLALDVYGIVAF
jgi:hypothetical protein